MDDYYRIAVRRNLITVHEGALADFAWKYIDNVNSMDMRSRNIHTNSILKRVRNMIDDKSNDELRELYDRYFYYIDFSSWPIINTFEMISFCLELIDKTEKKIGGGVT